MKTIAIDMDGVLADVYSQLSARHAEEFGKVLTMDEMTGRLEHEVFPNAIKYVNSPGFFRQATVMDGCMEVVRKLNDRYKLFIVSAAMEFPNSLTEKLAWMNEHFAFITWKQMVFCGSKEIIKADIMIDDHFKNLDVFTGETILFTQPHNAVADAMHHKRVNNWQGIEALLLS